MPLLQLHLSDQEIEHSVKDDIHRFSARILSEEIGKSIDFVMVMLNIGCSLSFAQDSESPCAYMEIKNVGELPSDTTKRLAKRLTSLVCDELKIEPDRIYIEFQESQRHLWGWNGNTFEI